ncbi:MAG: ABC transporter ATP-binding protein [Promethearchaeota archaeon]
MVTVTYRNVTKQYGEMKAVDNFNLKIQDEEFLVLVGPSGCGKTTGLRMLAGLETITSGDIFIGDKRVNDIDPKDRDLSMVFQSYALYPHLTVYDNLAFGLRNKRAGDRNTKIARIILSSLSALVYFLFLLPAIIGTVVSTSSYISMFFMSLTISLFTLTFLFENFRQGIRKTLLEAFSFIPQIQEFKEGEIKIGEKVVETAHLLEIEDQLNKKPRQLSGGQRQRVAVGRAIIRNPQVFLMDEPLSNLDAKLRATMRAELARLQQKLKITTIYVTHDQIEAMTLADRVCIMNKGIIQQVGTPDDVYHQPVNIFVAGFIGSPPMNFLQGRIENENFISDPIEWKIPQRYASLKNQKNIEILMGIRPEHIQISPEPQDNSIKATVGVIEPIGAETFLFADITEKRTLTLRLEGIVNFGVGEEINLLFDETQVHFFDTTTEERLKPQ